MENFDVLKMLIAIGGVVALAVSLALFFELRSRLRK